MNAYETFRRQFARRAANYILQLKKPLPPVEETVREVLRLGPLRRDQ